ncbi:MAG: 30S ribosomal protein S4 [Candidatus Woesearchaeota archaeon]
MGDPKKQRKKFSKPSHPWQKTRLEDESAIVKEYTLKNKREIWKMLSKLKHFTDQAKRFVSVTTRQMERERDLLLQSARHLGIIKETASLDDILGLELRSILDRRLQTFVQRKGFARTMAQARQFIVHKHIVVAGRVVSVPSYLVPVSEEDKISFVAKSSLSKPDHPERVVEKKPRKKAKVEQ